MNILLWVMQILLAAHTAMGAIWKFSNSEKVTAMLGVPRRAWLVISVVELLVSVGLLCTAMPSLAMLAPIAAACIVVEMLSFTALYIRNGGGKVRQPMAYWLVVAVFAAFIVYGRLALA